MARSAGDRDVLRREIQRIEGRAPILEHADPSARRFTLGVPAIDTLLGGGLERGALHEIAPAAVGGEGAASAFLVALVLRAAQENGAVIWITQDVCGREAGALHPPGLAQWGLAMERLVVVRAASAKDGLWAAEEALRCPALGAVILEPWGAPREFDLTALRRLSLAAERSRVTGFVLRQGVSRGVSQGLAQRSAERSAQRSAQESTKVFSQESPQDSRQDLASRSGAARKTDRGPGRGALPTATRWSVDAAPSPAVLSPAEWGEPRMDVPGGPVLTLSLLRNRLGPTGSWRLIHDPLTRDFRDADLVSAPGSDRALHLASSGGAGAAVSGDRFPVPAGGAPRAPRRLAAAAAARTG